MNRWIILSLGIWAIIVGLLGVTNIQIAWSGPLSGFAALVCGILCIVSVVSGKS
jgi:hypothetical protein